MVIKNVRRLDQGSISLVVKASFDWSEGCEL